MVTTMDDLKLHNKLTNGHDLSIEERGYLKTLMRLRPEHQCRPLGQAVMVEGRDWWIGELVEPVDEWPTETHCLHMKTPLKDVWFLCNAGDFEQLLVLSNVVVQLENLPWLKAATASARVRLQPPFSSVCSGCSGSGKTAIGCAVSSAITAPCVECSGTGRKARTIYDHEDKGTPHNEVFDRLAAEQDRMPRRYCAIHDREEFKYESLEHELHATKVQTTKTLSVIEGGNEPQPWACCNEFREQEERGEVIATETGYALMHLYPDTDASYNASVLDLKYCWACGTKLPEVSGAKRR